VERTPNRAREHAFVEARRRVSKLDEGEIASHLDRAFSPTHWRRLVPELTVEGRGHDGGRPPIPPGPAGPPASFEAAPLDDRTRAHLVARLRVEGWFHTEPFLDAGRIGAMRRSVETLTALGWPPVFAYVYDDFWEILRAPSLRRLLAGALGEGYRHSPRVWAHFVPAEKGASGWPPHVDGGTGTHTADRITLWIPLGEATLENGCMYLLPKHLLPAGAADDFASDMGSFDAASWRAMLQGARAVPARSGAVVGWDFEVIHWSSLAGEAEAPRVSLAVECLGEHIVPAPTEEPRLDPGALPPFAERLRAVARGLLSYERFEPAMLRFAGLARAMLETLDLGPERPEARGL
jgi:hypothetical protein